MSGILLLVLRILLTLLLYAFLGWVVFTLWRDLKAKADASRLPRFPAIKLWIGDEQNQPFYNQAEIVIGRERGCDLRLEDTTVSGRHARLHYHQGQWWLEDLQSTNGTALGSEILSVPVVLTDGDRIRCGQVELRVEIGD